MRTKSMLDVREYKMLDARCSMLGNAENTVFSPLEFGI